MALIQLIEMAKTVLTTTLCCCTPDVSAPLKDGQNIQRKILPTQAIKFDK